MDISSVKKMVALYFKVSLLPITYIFEDQLPITYIFEDAVCDFGH